MRVCVTQHFFRPRLSTALNAHGTNVSPGGLCARTQTKETSCWCGCRVGRARCGNLCTRYMAGPWYKKNSTVKYHDGLFCRVLPNETQLNKYSWAECACPQQRSDRVPKTCCRWYCQPSPPTNEGTEKQGKLCCRWRTAVVVVFF